jgi:hypothetical protein
MQILHYIQQQLLKQARVRKSLVRQYQVALQLSRSDYSEFPSELLQLNIEMIIRGLLNYAILQTKRDWIFPFWVHRQLDPELPDFVASSQNPLLINTTHRNWTLVGTPTGIYEAIIDPRGLLTPLPREWSLDVWLATDEGMFFPSRAQQASQAIDPVAPRVQTAFQWNGLELRLECFVDTIRRNIDIAFNRATVSNQGSTDARGWLLIALRPFNPEGVGVVDSIDVRSRRIAYVNNVVGVVFSKEPDSILCSNYITGDSASLFRKRDNDGPLSITCSNGLANAAMAFHFDLKPSEETAVDYSVALASEAELRQQPAKQTWRVPLEKRRLMFQHKWNAELARGAQFHFADQHLQHLFDTSRLTLLQLHDGDMITPGPFLYHHFWFRDAVQMVRALDLLGFDRRARQVLDRFPRRQAANGFFLGPEGEWDSNGAVLWSVYQHYRLTHSHFWLEDYFPYLLKGARWIQQMLRTAKHEKGLTAGLMPPSLSAEHFGPVDQYFWDTFWSVAGLISMSHLAIALGKHKIASEMSKASYACLEALRSVLKTIEQRLGYSVIPSTPHRSFDESAIGSVCAVYPLELHQHIAPYAQETVRHLVDRYVGEKGFYHPIFHSGYNPYLTLQLAHSLLYLGDDVRAWNVAQTIFRQASGTFSFPEAIHPRTGGGTMGDGHHGWVAAEIILFLRDSVLRESEQSLLLLQSAGPLAAPGRDLRIDNAPTAFGAMSFALTFESERKATFSFSPRFFPGHSPRTVHLVLSFPAARIVPVVPSHVLRVERNGNSTVIICSSEVRTLFIEL